MSMGKVLGGGSSVNANSSGYRDLALLGERFHVIEPERWNKMFSHQVSSAATPVSLESLAREKMSQNHITYDVSQSSWPTSVKIQTIRRSVLAAVASGASRSIVD
jgi:SRSO17 transposase